ncbi:MAG: radical SAM protein [Planctomycetales bacterium]|nr:radical SAM protein [Planctomycetales bacterium]
MSLTILYRGPLSSCNYECHYCPFAKRHESREELAADQTALERFVAWCARSCGPTEPLRVFFTPWGEALVRRWYRDAFRKLTNMRHVQRVAAQTNLSCRLDWLSDCDADKVGLWCTYHPSQTDRERFLHQVARLAELGVSHSVGMVGLREDLDEIERLRELLPTSTYLWVNALKREPDYYSLEDLRRLTAVDPQFPVNNRRHPSLGKHCLTGEQVITVDGAGDIRRCHFVPEVLGNIYDDHWSEALRPRKCTNDSCGCHIGYIHMPSLELYSIYGDGLLERRPATGTLTGAPSS